MLSTSNFAWRFKGWAVTPSEDKYWQIYHKHLNKLAWYNSANQDWAGL